MRSHVGAHRGLGLWFCVLSFVASVAAQTPQVSAPNMRQMYFEPNRGQAAPDRQFIGRSGRTKVLIDGSRFTIQSPHAGASTVALIGADGDVANQPEEPLPGTSSYFYAHQQVTDVPHFARLRYPKVYPGVDLVYYANPDGQLEFDFVVAPAADASNIRLQIEGGNLQLQHGTLRWRLADGSYATLAPPNAFQIDGSRRQPVKAQYVLAGNTLSIKLGRYDHRRELVIDPTVAFSTYLGGSGDDQGHAIAVDAGGSIYVTGSTISINFPTPGSSLNSACQNLGTCGDDVFVSKFSADGQTLIYTAFVGSPLNDAGTGIAVDAQGSAYVTGKTSGNSFPITAGAVNVADSGAFAFKLSPDGNALAYSALIGSSILPTNARIAVDSSGNAYIAGDFAQAPFAIVGGFDSTIAAGEGFLIKLNPSGTQVLYSTLIGGSANELVYGVAADSSGNAYVVGLTNSNDFNFKNALKSTKASNEDEAFLVKINTNLTGANSLVFGSYLGGSGSDGANAVALDASGNVYVAGITNSTDFPTANGYQSTRPASYALLQGWLTKFNSALTQRLYSTHFAFGANQVGLIFTDVLTPRGLAADSSGKVWMVGSTSSAGITQRNTIRSLCTKDANNICAIGFVAEFDTTQSGDASLLLSSYIGGNRNDSSIDEADDVALDSGGNPHIVGFTPSDNLQPLSNAFQGTCGSAGSGCADAYITKLFRDSSPAMIGISPLKLAFTRIAAGTTSASKVVTIKNPGPGAITVSSVVLGGTNAVNFGMNHNCGALAIGQSCSATVTFSPPSTGTFTAQLTISSNGSGSPHTVVLSGDGVPNVPDVSLNPTQINFPNTNVNGFAGGPQITLTNTGVALLHITSILTSSADFTKDGTTCGATLAPDASCTIDVSFTPTAFGLRQGSLNVTSDAPGSPHSVTLSGTGIGTPVPSLSPPSLAFGNQAKGITSAAQQVTLTNVGTGPLTITFIDTSAPQFAATHNCPGTLLPAAFCTIDVTFTPDGYTNFSGTLRINGPVPTSEIISGAGINPVPTLTSISPTSVIEGSAGFVMTLTGTNFNSTSAVTGFTAGKLPLTLTPTQITVQVTAADVATAGVKNIAVVNQNLLNATPPGGTSAAQTFTISANSPPEGALESGGFFNPLGSPNPSGGQFTKVTVVGWAADPNEGAPVAKVRTAIVPAAPANDLSGIVFTPQNDARIRRITPGGTIQTIAGTGTPGLTADGQVITSGQVNFTFAVTFDTAGNLIFADNGRIRKLTAATGVVTTLAGNGTVAVSADNSTAATSPIALSGPITLDAAGNIYFCEQNKIRKIDVATGKLLTYAGNGTLSSDGDNGQATAAGIGQARSARMDANGNLYILDGGRKVRKVDANTKVITTIAGNGLAVPVGDGGQATAAALADPIDIALDGSGNLYITDRLRVRKVVLATGIISTVAGTGVSGDSNDGIQANTAQLRNATFIGTDSANNVFFVDTGTNLQTRIRKITVATGIISTVANTPGSVITADGWPADETLLPTVSGGLAVRNSVSLASQFKRDLPLNFPRTDIQSSSGRADYLNSGYGASFYAAPPALLPGSYEIRTYAFDNNGKQTLLQPVKNITVTAQNAGFGTLSATALDFGPVLIHTTKVKSVTLKNDGNAPETINVTSFIEWGTTHNCASPLAPGAQCQINFFFSPQQLGARSRNFILTGNAVNQADLKIALSGEGVDITLQLIRPVRPPRPAGNLTEVQAGAFRIRVYVPPGTGPVQMSCGANTPEVGCSILPTTVSGSQEVAVKYWPLANATRGSRLRAARRAPAVTVRARTGDYERRLSVPVGR